MTLQTEVLPTENSDFLKQIIILNSYNSAFEMDISANIILDAIWHSGHNQAFSPKGYQCHQFFDIDSILQHL